MKLKVDMQKTLKTVLDLLDTWSKAQTISVEKATEIRKVEGQVARVLASRPRRCDKIEDRHSAIYKCRDYLQKMKGRDLSEDEDNGMCDAINYLYYEGEEK